jgi:dimethylhistidine N-methyltransferase
MRTESVGPVTLTDLEPTAADFRTEFLAGLRKVPRQVPSKFFYDARGSRLFDQICELPEYYPTRTELDILTRNLTAIREFCGPRCRLVELGSGSSRKTRLLLDHLANVAGYVPIDISRTHLLQAATALASEYPELEILPVCADYAQPIRLPASGLEPWRNVIFFPGSTIGNFEPAEAITFLRHVATWCQPGDRMIIGADLEKSRALLERAYNDTRGLTAAFNLNLLVRANREVGANFDLDRFSHQAIYNTDQGRIEMALVSGSNHVVEVEGERFAFTAGERMLTEFSHKYRVADFAPLVNDAGWSVLHGWSDSRGWFGVFALELTKPK